MPKIRQAIALLVAVAGCIAFNTFRYPVVREMAAVISAVGPSAAVKAGENPATSSNDSRHAGSTEDPADSPSGKVVCRDGVCTFASPESSTASIRSSSLGDSSEDTLKEASTRTASSANPEDTTQSASKSWGSSDSELRVEGATPSKSWPREGLDGNSPGTGETGSARVESRDSPLESTSQPRESETAAAKSPAKAVAGTGTIAKLVSTLGGGKSPPNGPDDSSIGETSLVPIQRPKPRPKKAKASSELSSSAMAKSSAWPWPADKSVRRLPPVDPASAADFLAAPPALSPDRVREYAVTPIK